MGASERRLWPPETKQVDAAGFEDHCGIWVEGTRCSLSISKTIQYRYKKLQEKIEMIADGRK